MSDKDSESHQDQKQKEAAKDAEKDFNSEKSSDLNPNGPEHPDDALPKAEQDERL